MNTPRILSICLLSSLALGESSKCPPSAPTSTSSKTTSWWDAFPWVCALAITSVAIYFTTHQESANKLVNGYSITIFRRRSFLEDTQTVLWIKKSGEYFNKVNYMVVSAQSVSLPPITELLNKCAELFHKLTTPNSGTTKPLKEILEECKALFKELQPDSTSSSQLFIRFYL